MTRIAAFASAALLLASPVLGQATPYGPPTPPGFAGAFDTAGQLPFVGNAGFGLRLTGHPNTFGGALALGFAPASTPFGIWTLLVDPVGMLILDLPPGFVQIPIAVPPDPGIVGLSGVAQAAVIDPAVPGGVGLTNGVQVTVLPDRTPTRAYFPGQDFSAGAVAPGQMSVLDLSVQPPVFRATGTVGFSGNIGENHANKIAVSESLQIAYALGNGTMNQFVRAFNVVSDPVGLVNHVPAGDIPIAGVPSGSVGNHDMEAMTGGQYLFVTSGNSTVTLEVFDTSNMPFVVPTASLQTISYPGAAGGAVGLEVSPNDDRLAVVVSSDSFSTITIYNITIGAPQPLGSPSFLTLGAFPGLYSPSDVHFSPDGRLLFVSGTNGVFNVIDTLPSPPLVLVGAGSWPAGGASLYFHGNAVAVQNGAPVGIMGSEGNGAQYHLVDLNMTSPTFGTLIGSFTTNPAGPGSNGNISNHRLHARQNIVVAIDGSGSTLDCQWIDVIDLDQPIPGGFQSWRVRTPNTTSLAPTVTYSCIPRDFDLF